MDTIVGEKKKTKALLDNNMKNDRKNNCFVQKVRKYVETSNEIFSCFLIFSMKSFL